MNIFSRAMKYLKVKKIKSLLLILVFFVIGNFVVIMFGINQTADNTKKIIRRQMQPIVEFYPDHEAYRNYLEEKYGGERGVIEHDTDEEE